MKTGLSLRMLVALTFIASSQILSAQLTSYTMQSGVAETEHVATTTLAPDAMLVQAGALGDSVVDAGSGPAHLVFDLGSGMANAWAYTYYSSSRNAYLSLVLIEIPSLGHQVMPTDLPVKLPADLNKALNTGAPYYGSDRMMARLNADTTFRRYRSDLPLKRPWTVGLRQMSASETATLPVGMQGEQTMWVMTFNGGKDTGMKCYVSATTGQTYCRRASEVALVDRSDEASTSRIVTYASHGSQLTVTARCNERPDVAVYAVDGTIVPSHIALWHRDDGWFAEVGLSNLPAGIYFCRVTGSGWGQTIPVTR